MVMKAKWPIYTIYLEAEWPVVLYLVKGLS